VLFGQARWQWAHLSNIGVWEVSEREQVAVFASKVKEEKASVVGPLPD
jgi:hypothetical protein